MGGGKGSLGLFDFSLEFLYGSLVAGNIDVILLLNLFNEEFHSSLIEIFSSQVSISGSSHNLENSVINGQNRHIKGTSSEIENENVLLS